MNLGRLLLALMGTALLTQSLTFALHFGWGGALGAVLLGLGLGHLLAPALRANEGRRLGALLLNLASVLGSLAAANRATETACLVSTAVVVMLLHEEGPHLRRRWRERWRGVARRLARPVIALPS